MFNVYLDGVYHSTHQTFTGACRHARMEAASNQQSYFTVFEAGDESEDLLLDNEKEVMKGVPDYIIAPHTVASTSHDQRKVGVATLAAAASIQAARLSRGA